MDKPLCLIVEDEPIYLVIIAEVLESLGYGTLAARSEREAMGLLRSAEPALVIMDIHLHGRPSGIELIRFIRAGGESGGCVPIIGVSAADFSETHAPEASGPKGMNAFVSKLSLVQGLAEAVRKVAWQPSALTCLP